MTGVLPAIWLMFFTALSVFYWWTYLDPFASARAIVRPMRWLFSAPPAPFYLFPHYTYVWTHESEVDDDTPEARAWFKFRRVLRMFALLLALVTLGLVLTVPASALLRQ